MTRTPRRDSLQLSMQVYGERWAETMRTHGATWSDDDLDPQLDLLLDAAEAAEAAHLARQAHVLALALLLTFDVRDLLPPAAHTAGPGRVDHRPPAPPPAQLALVASTLTAAPPLFRGTSAAA